MKRIMTPITPRFGPCCGLRRIAHSAGDSVSALMAERNIATATVTANCRNNSPEMPEINPTGTNTASSTSVIAMIGANMPCMGFVSEEGYQRFLKLAPIVEKFIVNAGIILIKLWLEVGKEEQERRFLARINDPMRQWKLSSMDIESYTHWDDYTKARDKMFDVTDSKEAPWYIIRSDDKRRARLNCISHILSAIPHKKIKNDKVKLPKRPKKNKYDDQRGLKGRNFVHERY